MYILHKCLHINYNECIKGGFIMEKLDRIKGALMGAFIGEALGVGPHWYYDLKKLHKDYGTWIDDYTAPKKGRYHEGLKAGALSQQGWLIQKMTELIVKEQGYSLDAFKTMLETDIFPHLDGTPMGGKGGYTSQVMRHIYYERHVLKKDWKDVASLSDTTESLERNIPLGLFYHNDLSNLSQQIAKNTALTQKDNVTGSLSVAYNVVLAFLINGHALDESISDKMMEKVHDKTLPFFAVTTTGLEVPNKRHTASKDEGLFASPDALLSPAYMAASANDPDIKIEPAWKVSLVYGMPCAIYHMLPSVYYLAARFKDDFESGVLHAINGGGQNQVRALLTGALIGAQVGFKNIPKRFIEGLDDKENLLNLVEDFARLIEK